MPSGTQISMTQQQKASKKKSSVLLDKNGRRIRNKKRPFTTTFNLSEELRDLLTTMSALEGKSFSEFCAVGLETYIEAKLEQHYKMSRQEFLQYWDSKTGGVVKIHLPQTQVAA